ncbi:MAG: polysaccharide biosynthesis/export family protein [Candidatus Korobacteraceae bacterium]|jgi:polysaccharide export outer membrane protein
MKNRQKKLVLALGVGMALSGFMLRAQAPTAAEANGGSQAGKTQPSSARPDAESHEPPSGNAAVKPHDDTFIIGNTDVLAINVWKEPEISRTLPVRSDGRISLPLVGEVQAAGRTPLQLEQEISTRLKDFISNPEVAVMVEQINSQKFNILGMVLKPGTYPLTLTTTVLDAIAAAGGFRDFAKQKSIYVLRQDPKGGETRIPFNYKEVIKGQHPEQNIKLKPNDTVVVP